MPLIALLVFAKIVRKKHFEVAGGSAAEGRSVFLRPDFEVSYSHPTQKLPARQVNTHEVSVKHAQRCYEQREADTYQEKEKGKDLSPLAQLLIIFFVP